MVDENDNLLDYETVDQAAEQAQHWMTEQSDTMVFDVVDFTTDKVVESVTR